MASSPSGTSLAGVAAISLSDAWAVCSDGPTGSLVEHWDGPEWAVVSNPPGGPPGSSNYLTAVTALSSNSVWAVGFFRGKNTNYLPRTLTLHWNGTAWSVVSSPSPGQAANLYGIAGLATGNVWTVGDYGNV